MKSKLVIIILCISHFSNLSAQNTNEVNRANQIISKVAEAMGGIDVINKIETIRVLSVYPDHGDKPIPTEIGLPNMSRYPNANLVFDGEKACFLTGRKESKKPEFVNEEELMDFEIEIGLFFPAFFDHPTEYSGIEMIGEFKTHHLKTSLPSETILDYYIDMETFLPVKANAKFILYDKEIEWGREYFKYTEIDGILYPMEFTYPGRDDKTLKAVVEKVEINKVDKSVFEIPKNILN